MELVCPKCETHFFVADNAIGPNGREVRCSVCENVWNAKPSGTAKAPDPPKQAAAATLTKPASASRPASASDPASDDEFHWPPDKTAESPRENKQPERPAASASKPAPATVQSATSIYASPPEAADGEPHRQRGGSKRLVIGILLLLFVGLTYGLREQIVEAFPNAARLYELAGIPVSAQQSQLSVTEVELTAIDQSGTAMVRITGFVGHDGPGSTPIPQLEVTLTGKDGSQLFRQTFAPPQSVAESKSPVRFQYDIPVPAAAVSNVEVRLIPGDK